MHPVGLEGVLSNSVMLVEHVFCSIAFERKIE